MKSGPTTSGYWDVYGTGEATNGKPKLLVMIDCIEINDFNYSLMDVFKEFCKKNDLYFALLPNKVAISFERDRKDNEFIEQLKLFYL